MRISDWSSDVCSADLQAGAHQRKRRRLRHGGGESGHREVVVLEQPAKIGTEYDAGHQGRTAEVDVVAAIALIGRPELMRQTAIDQNGSASGREKVCQEGSIPVGAGTVNKQKQH